MAAIVIAPLIATPVAQASPSSDAIQQCTDRLAAIPYTTQDEIDRCIAAVKQELAEEQQNWNNCMDQYHGVPGGPGQYCGNEPK
jgi:hypothetical protein